jgi:hypothetical protein
VPRSLAAVTKAVRTRFVSALADAVERTRVEVELLIALAGALAPA